MAKTIAVRASKDLRVDTLKICTFLALSKIAGYLKRLVGRVDIWQKTNLFILVSPPEEGFNKLCHSLT